MLMSPKNRTYRKIVQGKFGLGIGVLLTLAILGGTIFLAREYLRQNLRTQIAGRDAHLLERLCQIPAQEDLPLMLSDDPLDQLSTVLEASQLSQLSGMLATRLFDPEGRQLHVFPPYAVSDGTLSRKDLIAMRELRPVSHFHPHKPLSDLLMDPMVMEADTLVPIHEVIVPLYLPDENRLLGIAQFILHGEDLAEEFARLDRNLTIYASAAFAVSGSVTVLILLLAFRKLQRTNDILSKRTEDLLKANQELALAAKTSAVGAVSAHLIHGLKNPLFGLQSFISQYSSNGKDGDGEWQAAISTARRMQTLVNEVVRVLKEEQGTAQYEMSLEELQGALMSKIGTPAREKGVILNFHWSGEGDLSNRDANLILLVLENLAQNAIQATPPGKAVTFKLAEAGEWLVLEIADEGPGLPEVIQNCLFTPVQSTKEGGSGIGLAISKQLASHLGAELDVAGTSPAGTVFRLSIPKKLIQRESCVSPSSSATF